ncbi:MAG: hypothetical protein HZC40_05310 [Chloroflexi bacterium]|nr:hypothetical protein [Chloroflexota bacterium]
MTVQNLMLEIRNLSLEEQFQLLESITRALRETWRPSRRAGVAVNRVRGCLKPTGIMPTDTELVNLRDQYLNGI